jgi:hypothetical protein
VKFLLRKSEAGEASEVWQSQVKESLPIHTSPQGVTSLRSNFTAPATSLAAGKLR